MGKLEIILIQGDIADVAADAVVNAANNHLWMGAGVAGALKRKGGSEIEKEAVKKGPIPIGEAIVTSAGKLKARYVIHAAVMGPNLITNTHYIRNATKNSLKLAEKLRLKSIAFPALGTGVGGFSKAECAQIMLAEVKTFEKGAMSETNQSVSSLEKILFVLYDQSTYQIFAGELKQLRPANHPGLLNSDIST